MNIIAIRARTAVRAPARRLAGAWIVATLMLAAALFAPPARAVEYDTVLPRQSAVTFAFEQMGVSIDGRFRRFDADIRFDPAKPERGRASIEIDLTSIDAGSSDANDEAAGRLWFNSKTYPRARFVSKRVQTLGTNRYALHGTLTIKGRSRDLMVPVQFTPAGSGARFDGAFTLKRLDFGIGEGMWADVDTVANEVKVAFRITASGK